MKITLTKAFMKITLDQKLHVVFTRHGHDVAMRTWCPVKQVQSGNFTLQELMSTFGQHMHGPVPLFEEIEILEEGEV